MRNVLAIACKELSVFRGSPWFFGILAAFLFFTGYGFGWTPQTFMKTSIQGLISWGGFFLIPFGPAISMRLLAEEEREGTFELLLTSPVRELEIVVGKYLAVVGILALMILLSMVNCLILAWFGDPDWGIVFAGYLGLFQLGCVILAIGLFTSSLTSRQFVAYILASSLTLILWFADRAALMTSPDLEAPLRRISLSAQFMVFQRGLLDSSMIVYQASLIVVFLFLTIRSLETRRWR